MTARPRDRVTVFLLAMTILLAIPLSASTITSALTGRITSGGKPVAGATVTLTSEALQHPRFSRTGSYGTYWLTALPPGVYEVTFSAKGMQTITRRATIELARVSRADAVLEPSEDEEHVTSTARTVSVVDTTAVTTHFSDFVLDRLPVRRQPGDTSLLTPGPPDSFVSLDGAVFLPPPFFAGEESIEQITHIRAAGPIEDHRGFGNLAVLRMRSGSNDFFLSLRDSFTRAHGNTENLVEGAGGGPIVRDRLWLFAGGWTGDELFSLGPVRGYALKLSGQIGASHSLVATSTATKFDADLLQAGTWATKNAAAVQYTGALSPRVTVESTVSRLSNRLQFPTYLDHLDQEVLLTKATYVLPSSRGDHVLTAGGVLSGTTGRGISYDETVLFFNDRWARERWVIEAGVRRQSFADREYHPRLAAVYDIRGNGRHTASATYASYQEPGYGGVTELTAGYTMAIGSSGSSFRADLFRRRAGFGDKWGIELDAAYRLFDRLTAGGNYTYSGYDDTYGTPRHVANGWLSIDFPLDTHVFGLTVLQRYRHRPSTDFGLRYRMPAGRTALTFAGDLTNVFNDNSIDAPLGQALRLWVRLRL